MHIPGTFTFSAEPMTWFIRAIPAPSRRAFFTNPQISSLRILSLRGRGAKKQHHVKKRSGRFFHMGYDGLKSLASLVSIVMYSGFLILFRRPHAPCRSLPGVNTKKKAPKDRVLRGFSGVKSWQ